MNVDLAREQLIKDLLSQFNNPRNIGEKIKSIKLVDEIGRSPVLS